jgi:uncharacterized membrane protein
VGVPGSLETRLTGLNNANHMVGTYMAADHSTHGFLMIGETITEIAYPGAIGTTPTGINNLGQIVGTYVLSGGTTLSFLLSDGVYHPGPSLGNFLIPYDINDNNQIVGAYYDGHSTHGFLATATANPVPEPTSLLLLASGVAGLSRWRKRLSVGESVKGGWSKA